MITLLLIIVAGALNATYEILFTNFKDSIFKDLNLLFWDPQRSWIFKWKQPFYPAERKWYYFGVYPRYQERFPYSSTILVWATDAWHLFKALMLGCIMLAIVFYTPLVSLFVDFFIFYLGFTFTFTLFYDYILRKK